MIQNFKINPGFKNEILNTPNVQLSHKYLIIIFISYFLSNHIIYHIYHLSLFSLFICNIPFYEESACVISLKTLYFFLFLKTKALKKLEALRNQNNVLEILEVYIHIPKFQNNATNRHD